MSEKIIWVSRPLVCDLCGHRSPRGTKCRMVRDDFMPMLTFFEHLRCPSAPACAKSERDPKEPVESSCRKEPVLA